MSDHFGQKNKYNPMLKKGDHNTGGSGSINYGGRRNDDERKTIITDNRIHPRVCTMENGGNTSHKDWKRQQVCNQDAHNSQYNDHKILEFLEYTKDTNEERAQGDRGPIMRETV